MQTRWSTNRHASHARSHPRQRGLRRNDLREALQILWDRLGYSQSSSMNKSVASHRLSSTNVTIERALTQILLPLGYVWVYRDGVYMVATSDPRSPLFCYVARAFSTSRSSFRYQARRTSTYAFQRVLPGLQRTQSLIIDAPELIGQDLASRLQELDQPIEQSSWKQSSASRPQISNFRFGMDWNHVVNIGGADHLKLGMIGLPSTAEPAQPASTMPLPTSQSPQPSSDCSANKDT